MSEVFIRTCTPNQPHRNPRNGGGCDYECFTKVDGPVFIPNYDNGSDLYPVEKVGHVIEDLIADGWLIQL